jgi:hypothetical protein
MPLTGVQELENHFREKRNLEVLKAIPRTDDTTLCRLLLAALLYLSIIVYGAKSLHKI